MTAAIQADLFVPPSDVAVRATSRDSLRLGPPPAPTAAEAVARDAALDALEARRHDYLVRIRAAMALLYEERRVTCAIGGCWVSSAGVETIAFVTGDDARGYFETLGPPIDLSRNFLGQVFRDGRWLAVPGRRVLSRTRGSHANELKCWILSSTTTPETS